MSSFQAGLSPTPEFVLIPLKLKALFRRVPCFPLSVREILFSPPVGHLSSASYLLSQLRCQHLHFLQKAVVGVSEGGNSFVEGGVGIYHFFQYSFTHHLNSIQTVETNFQILQCGRGGVSHGRFLPPASTAERSPVELFRLLPPAWILMVSFMSALV